MMKAHARSPFLFTVACLCVACGVDADIARLGPEANDGGATAEDAMVDVARDAGDAQPMPVDDAADSDPPDVDADDAGCAAEITCPAVDPTKPAHIDCIAPASLHVGDHVTLDIVGTNLADGANPPIVEIDVVSPPSMGGQALNGSPINACHVQVTYVVPSQSGQVSVFVGPGGTIAGSNKVLLAVRD
jgi:hypothetical protein